MQWCTHWGLASWLYLIRPQYSVSKCTFRIRHPCSFAFLDYSLCMIRCHAVFCFCSRTMALVLRYTLLVNDDKDQTFWIGLRVQRNWRIVMMMNKRTHIILVLKIWHFHGFLQKQHNTWQICFMFTETRLWVAWSECLWDMQGNWGPFCVGIYATNIIDPYRNEKWRYFFS
jgi:hypothetical protein